VSVSDHRHEGADTVRRQWQFVAADEGFNLHTSEGPGTTEFLHELARRTSSGRIAERCWIALGIYVIATPATRRLELDARLETVVAGMDDGDGHVAAF
jgi:hypothetical protein